MAINFDMPQIYEGRDDIIRTFLYDITHNLYAITTFFGNPNGHKKDPRNSGVLFYTIYYPNNPGSA